MSDARENRINTKSDKMCLLYLEFLVLRLFSGLNKTFKYKKMKVLTDSDLRKPKYRQELDTLLV